MANDKRKSRFTRICVFCGTNTGARPEYGAAARELAWALLMTSEFSLNH